MAKSLLVALLHLDSREKTLPTHASLGDACTIIESLKSSARRPIYSYLEWYSVKEWPTDSSSSNCCPIIDRRLGRSCPPQGPFPPPRLSTAFTVAIYHSNMSYHDHSGGYPPLRDQPESQYPPPPGEEDDRVRAYHQRMPSAGGSITLPSISPYDPQYGQPPNGYQQDPRAYQQDPYRPPPGPYRDERAYPQEYGRGAPPPQHMAFSQSAPRQRTAIACRYCRRRKVSKKHSPLRSREGGATPLSGSSINRKRGIPRRALILRSVANNTLDSLLWIRPKSRGTLLKLPALPARVYLHSSLLASAGFCPSSRSLPKYAEYGIRARR